MSGQDRELVDDRVRRLGRDDARLGQADVAARLDALLGMADGRALHRALHRARAAARADVEAAQAELVAHELGVLVLVAADRVPAPAHDDVGPHARLQQARIAQHAVHRVGDARGLAQLDAAVLVDLAVDVEDVAQHREQVLLDAADHAAVDERGGRRIVQLELDAPGLAHDVDVEVGVAVEDRARVVGLAAAVQHRQRAAAIQRVEAAARGVEQPVDLHLREVLEAARRRDARVDETVVVRRARRESRPRPVASSRADLDRDARPSCAARRRPCRHCSARCSRRSSHASRSAPAGASARSAGRGS